MNKLFLETPFVLLSKLLLHCDYIRKVVDIFWNQMASKQAVHIDSFTFGPQNKRYEPQCNVHHAKIQINQHIHTVWSEASLCTIWIAKDAKFLHVDNEDWPWGYKTFFMLSWSWIFLLINLRLLTIENSFLLNIAEHENFSVKKYENANYCWHFHMY